MTQPHIEALFEAHEKWNKSERASFEDTNLAYAADTAMPDLKQMLEDLRVAREALEKSRVYSSHNFDCLYHQGDACSCGSYEFYKATDGILTRLSAYSWGE